MIITLSGVTGVGKSYFKNQIHNKLGIDIQTIVTKREKRNPDNFWRNTFMGISLLCKRKSYYMDNPNTYFIW